MLLKCHHHLHPLSRNAIFDKCVDEDYNLDIFEITTNTNERACQQGISYFQEVLGGSKRYQMSSSMVGKA